MMAHLVWNATFAAVCLASLLYGRRPERVTAVVLLTADLVSAIPIRGLYWRHIEPSLFSIDLCVALFFVFLALKSSRWWPLWAAAFHLLAVVTLVINALDPEIRPYAYYVGELIWDYLGLLALFLGVLFEGRRIDVGFEPFQASSKASAR